MIWFLAFHESTHGEKPNESVIKRYQTEVERLRIVLDNHLQKTKNGFVALDRLTIVDFAILPWLKIAALAGPALKPYSEYSALGQYIEKLDKLAEVQKAYAKAVPPQ